MFSFEKLSAIQQNQKHIHTKAPENQINLQVAQILYMFEK